MNASAITILSFVAAATAIAGVASLVYDLYFRDRWSIKSRLDEEFHSQSKGRGGKSSLFKQLRMLEAETSQSTPTLGMRFRSAVEQSGLPITVETLLTISVATALVAGIATFSISRNWMASVGVLLAGL